MYFLLKLVIFHCYVSLPEGTPPQKFWQRKNHLKKWMKNGILSFPFLGFTLPATAICSFLVPLIGGRLAYNHYKWYISGIYCQLGDYISPIPPIKGTRKQLLSICGINFRAVTTIDSKKPPKDHPQNFMKWHDSSWLVVEPTPLKKYERQIEWISPRGETIQKYLSCHHLGDYHK